MRDKILNNVKNHFKSYDKVYLLMIVPIILKNYNDETIFSEEVDDLHWQLFVTNKKVFTEEFLKIKFVKILLKYMMIKFMDTCPLGIKK